MKICFLCNEYPPFTYGGIGILVQTMARSLVARGHQVIVTGVYPGINKIITEREKSLEIFRLPAIRVKKVGWLLNRMWLSAWIMRLFHRSAIELIESPDYEGWSLLLPSWIPQLVRLHSSVSVLQSCMGSLNRRSTSFLLEKIALKRSKNMVAVSRFVGEITKEVFGLPRMQYEVIPNWTVLPRQINDQPEIEDTVLFFGTIGRIKGIDLLLKAWPRVVARHPAARLVIAGKDMAQPPLLPQLLQRLPDMIRGNVRYLGHLSHPEMMAAVLRASVICLPSLFESQSLATLESMARGKAVIFTKLGPGPEIITPGIDGWLLDPHNPMEIAEAILWLLQNPEARRQMGKRARLTVEKKFSPEVILPQNIKLYEELRRK